MLGEVLYTIDEAISQIEDVRDEEQDAFDSMPEGLQYSKSGDSMQAAIDDMDEIICDLSNVQNKILDMIKPKKKSTK